MTPTRYFLGLLLLWSWQLCPAFAWTADVDRRQAVSECLRVTSSLATGATVATTSSPKLAWASDSGVSSYLSDLSDYQSGPRGLQYKILRQGEGQTPLRGQQVFAKYTLWTGGFGEDGGKQVDSNTGFLGRPLPVIVGVGRVIKGWDLTLLDMKVGEIRRIVVPSDIGYGDKGAGGAIPPKATLYFEIEITDMDPPPKLTETQQKWLEENPL